MRGGGLLEETLVLAPTTQSLVSEGIAQLAPSVLFDSDGGPELAAVMHDAGIEFDLPHALAVRQVLEPCGWAEVNAALMLHDAGASEAEVRAYLERWGLMTPELATHMIRFLNEPTSRTYVITYPAGQEFCHAYVGGDLERFHPPAFLHASRSTGKSTFFTGTDCRRQAGAEGRSLFRECLAARLDTALAGLTTHLRDT